MDAPSSPSAAAAASAAEGRRRDRAAGIAIVVASFLATLAISYWSRHASAPEKPAPPAPPRTDGIVGWPAAVDPVATLAAARRITKRNYFRGMIAVGVARDGTLDCTKKTARVRYAFQSKPGQGPQPPRPPGTLPKRTYCGKQNVHLKQTGLVADPDVATYPCPARWTDALPTPRCNARAVWDRAVADGADPKRLAKIEYYRSRVGPAWRFEIPGTRHRFTLYGDCKREITGPDAVGSVP